MNQRKIFTKSFYVPLLKGQSKYFLGELTSSVAYRFLKVTARRGFDLAIDLNAVGSASVINIDNSPRVRGGYKLANAQVFESTYLVMKQAQTEVKELPLTLIERSVTGNWYELDGIPNINMGESYLEIAESRFIRENEAIELTFEYVEAA